MDDIKSLFKIAKMKVVRDVYLQNIIGTNLINIKEVDISDGSIDIYLFDGKDKEGDLVVSIDSDGIIYDAQDSNKYMVGSKTESMMNIVSKHFSINSIHEKYINLLQ